MEKWAKPKSTEILFFEKNKFSSFFVFLLRSLSLSRSGIWASAVYLFHYRFSVFVFFVCLFVLDVLVHSFRSYRKTYESNVNTMHISPEIGRFVEQLQWKLKDFPMFFPFYFNPLIVWLIIEFATGVSVNEREIGAKMFKQGEKQRKTNCQMRSRTHWTTILYEWV